MSLLPPDVVTLLAKHELAPGLQVAVGVGTLAGSTIMLLTVAWGGSVLAGRCDIGPSVRARLAACLARASGKLARHDRDRSG